MLSRAILAVLRAVADGHRYGFDIIEHTGLAGGTVYPALSSLSDRKLLSSRWEADDDGIPARRAAVTRRTD